MAGPLDLEVLLDAEDPAEAVAAVEPTQMYHALVKAGPEDSLSLIPLLTPEQFVKIVDYEGWDRDRLSLGAALRWLDACRSVSKEELFRKYSCLEEEVQTGLLGPYVDFIEEDQYELLPQSEQDTFQQLPCRTAWWRIKTDDPALRGVIEDLVEGGLETNLPYTYSLLAHAAYLPPNEQEDMARQFRNARLEEDGFIPFEDALEIFRRVDPSPLARRLGYVDGRDCLAQTLGAGAVGLSAHEASNDFFAEVIKASREQGAEGDQLDLPSLQQTVAHLVNTVCSALQITPENEEAIKLVMAQVKGLIGTALDILSGSDRHRAVRLFATIPSMELFQFTVGLVDIVRGDAIAAMRHAAIPAADKIERLWQSRRFGALLFCIDTELLETVGFESAEMLKGLFNRFPMRPVSQRFLPDGDRRIVFGNLKSRADLLQLSQEAAQIESKWSKQQ